MHHRSANSSHYDTESRAYDAFNERDSRVINGTLEGILRRHGVVTVLDLTCGTGSQAFWLAERGFEVTGLDISSRMLAIARRKARGKGSAVRFLKGDVRTSRM
ncbi:MAG TPA: class I SAM-dependent methyltransferase, partial [Planctomycetota bacterium]|nr:class I SAM-dependent methyltransferase [Planctomycetota bacterium]